MQAPKNGFFYVLDRETGQAALGQDVRQVTWATGIDLKTGRPVVAPNIRYQNGEAIL